MCPPQKFEDVSLLYDTCQLVEPNTWNGEAHPISIYGSIKLLDIDVKNITTSLFHMMNFIKCQSIDQKYINDVQSLNGFDEATWLLISSIYESS